VPDANPPRLLSFTLDAWSVLGGPVTVSLEDRVAVLVGRNGAGKSAILEGFEAIASRAIGKINGRQPDKIENFPRVLNIEIMTPYGRRLKYKYEVSSFYTEVEPDPTDDYQELVVTRFSWDDCCQYLDCNNEILWTTELGVTTFETEENKASAILGNTSSLVARRQQYSESVTGKIPDEMNWIYSILAGVRLVGKSTIRQDFNRRPSFLQNSRQGFLLSSSSLIDHLARQILYLSSQELDELTMICSRIGISQKISIKSFEALEGTKENAENKESLHAVLMDETNIGLLSDGTLRILSILVALIKSSSISTTIIEEPEMQIHPGLLEKLLNEIGAYTFEENLILSSHSPQVVAWTDPNKINLVYRQDGRTYIRKLGENDIHQVTRYLQEDGNLGEWIYSGILDE
jgi:ABC-type cobalamin/Fe3+-siderophores transport system ATPase subunit